MSLTNRTVKSPKPGLRNLLVSVDEDSFAAEGGILPNEGVLYRDFPKSLIAKDYFKKFADFRYVEQGPDSKTGGSLLFVKSMTDAERNTPYRTIPSKDNHYWHPLLRALEVLQSPHSPRSYPGTLSEIDSGGTVTTNPVNFSGPSFFVRQDYVPAATEGTLFVRSFYFGDVSFDVQQTPCPQPSSVAYDFPGCSGNFPECLHDDIIIKAQQIVTQAVSLGGSATPTPAGLGGQFFPATDFTGRVAYILYARQHFEGGYNLETALVIPPPEPEVSVR